MNDYGPEMKGKMKERLKKIIDKKLETTMIHSLSQFEMAFGHLWKHGVAEDKLTEEELFIRQKWEQCRSNILNMGNHQRRNARKEIDMYDVIWKRYTTVLYPVEQTRED